MILHPFFTLLRNYKTKNIYIQLYHFLRLSIFPLKSFFLVFQKIKHGSNIISIGCGYGTIETLLAIFYPKIHITGCDTSVSRILAAQNSTKHLQNLSFIQVDASSINLDLFDTIICNDILHHLEDTSQTKLLKKISQNNIKSIIIKDVDLFPRWKYMWNYFHDFIMAGPPLNYKPSSFFDEYLKNVGFFTTLTRLDIWQPYNHYILYAHKTNEA